MKKTITAATIAVLIFGLAPKASAVFGTTVTMDEFGNGSIDPLIGPVISLGKVFDPLTGLSPLEYVLPFAVINGGDLVMLEPDALGNPTSVTSDLLRFIPRANSTLVQFFSDNSDGVDAPADVGIPPDAFGPINNVVTEQGSESGPNGYLWHPAFNEVGFADGLDVAYNIISDVPEPTTMIAGALLLLPFGASTLRVLRKKHAA